MSLQANADGDSWQETGGKFNVATLNAAEDMVLSLHRARGTWRTQAGKARLQEHGPAPTFRFPRVLNLRSTWSSVSVTSLSEDSFGLVQCVHCILRTNRWRRDKNGGGGINHRNSSVPSLLTTSHHEVSAVDGVWVPLLCHSKYFVEWGMKTEEGLADRCHGSTCRPRHFSASWTSGQGSSRKWWVPCVPIWRRGEPLSLFESTYLGSVWSLSTQIQRRPKNREQGSHPTAKPRRVSRLPQLQLFFNAATLVRLCRLHSLAQLVGRPFRLAGFLHTILQASVAWQWPWPWQWQCSGSWLTPTSPVAIVASVPIALVPQETSRSCSLLQSSIEPGRSTTWDSPFVQQVAYVFPAIFSLGATPSLTPLSPSPGKQEDAEDKPVGILSTTSVTTSLHLVQIWPRIRARTAVRLRHCGPRIHRQMAWTASSASEACFYHDGPPQIARPRYGRQAREGMPFLDVQ